MPIDIDQLRALVKFAEEKGKVDSTAETLSAAAQLATPPGGIPLAKPIDTSASGEALDEQKAQEEQEKKEQEHRKELDAKENEIRGLRHELELEKVERQKATNNHELDLRVRQEEDRLKSEKEKLERDRFQLVQEKARQDNMFKAEEMKHQADMDKITFKQEAEIAKQQAKATADLAKQQANQYVKANDQARKASDKYYADAQNRLKSNSPAISPALQNQLDNAISSLNRFRSIHKKQSALPKPGTPPDFAKLAMVKWAESYYDRIHNNAMQTFADREAKRDQKDLVEAGSSYSGTAYDSAKAYAAMKNNAAKARDDGDEYEAARYDRLANSANSRADTILSNHRGDNSLAAKQDAALTNSYRDKRTHLSFGTQGKAIPGFGWLDNLLGGGGLKYINASAQDTDADAYNQYKKAKDYDENANWFQQGVNYLAEGVSAPFLNIANSFNDMRANMRNADYFGANRFWNTTFDDPRMEAAYKKSLQHGYGDSIAGDIGRLGLHTSAAASYFAPGWAKLVAIPLGIASNYVGNQELKPTPDFNFEKPASVIPVPGAPPITKKADAGNFTAQAANTGYDWASTNNSWYNNPYEYGWGPFLKFMSPIVSSITGNSVNLMATPGKYMGYLSPKSIISGQTLAQNVVMDSDHKSGVISNVHDAVRNAAAAKHLGAREALGNFNSTADFRNNKTRFA